MNQRADPRLVRRCAGVATGVSVFVMAAGLAVLAGWTLHIVPLVTWGAATPMASGSSAAAVLAGLSLGLSAAAATVLALFCSVLLTGFMCGLLPSSITMRSNGEGSRRRNS
ncbi:MAG TPA: hypothetical protein VN828_14315 [Acidobacteriaceae bacterium]|nr:hypothetical protein [Acidobacteriaceae bacterium]